MREILEGAPRATSMVDRSDSARFCRSLEEEREITSNVPFVGIREVVWLRRGTDGLGKGGPWRIDV